jgi:hypothetical protein
MIEIKLDDFMKLVDCLREIEAQNADLLAALKAVYENRLVIDALDLAGLYDELDAIGQAIAKAEGSE